MTESELAKRLQERCEGYAHITGKPNNLIYITDWNEIAREVQAMILEARLEELHPYCTHYEDAIKTVLRFTELTDQLKELRGN